MNLNEKAEIIKCANSSIYFCENYVKLVKWDGRTGYSSSNFKAYEFRRKYFEALENHRFVIHAAYRCGGWTSTTLAWFLWKFLFSIDQKIMVYCKSDYEATNCNKKFFHMLQHVPKFLKPTLTKCNNHCIESEDNNCSIWFYTPEPACGRALNYIFIDQAALVPKMDFNWPAMYPMLSCGGNCIISSTPNGAHGWFYETYKKALKVENNMYVFTSSYKENPECNNVDWVETQMKNLGVNGYNESVLCEFLGDKDANTN